MQGTQLDQTCINTIRCTAADMVQAANSGHPGAPMGCAPMGHALFGHTMKYNPSNPSWWNRDRFVLSNGHACALQYTMLCLAGYKDITVEDLKKFRQLGSKTAGHPENFLLEGIEVSTGPLGQGVSNAVGLAAAQANLAANFNRPDAEIFDNYTYAIVGDGCLQEGVAAESTALAGHLGLGRLIVLYDDNSITIDGDTELSFTENVPRRFEAIGWQVLEVPNGDTDLTDIVAKIEEAKKCKDKPTLIKIKTTIGYGSSKQGTAKTHGAPLGAEDLAGVKTKFGFDPTKSFVISEEVKAFYKGVKARGEAANKTWDATLAKYAKAHAAEYAELTRRFGGELPEGWEACLPAYKVGDAPKATRLTSGEILAALMDRLPEVVGGSADLTSTNMTNMGSKAGMTKHNLGNPYMWFGVREHGMSAIANGMHAYGGFIPFVATFVNFIGYCWGATRLSALSGHQVLYVTTHDSIDLGEDGPTHQPVEILSLLRATPNLVCYRPCDGIETVGGYKFALGHKTGPTVFILNRSALPNLEGSSIEKSMKGGYVLQDFSGKGKKVILMANGSEVLLIHDAKKKLAESGVDARVVSFPSWELYEQQSQSYKDSVFPKGIKRLYVEASNPLGFEKYADDWIAMTTFGASGPAKDVKAKFGFTVENICAKATKLAA